MVQKDNHVKAVESIHAEGAVATVADEEEQEGLKSKSKTSKNHMDVNMITIKRSAVRWK